MREQQEYEKATELYSMIKNDPDYKKAYEVNDKTEMNQAIGNVVWDHNDDREEPESLRVRDLIRR